MIGIFAEKLNFMMQLTATTNSRLAAAINVDPSLISKLKSGVRTVTAKSDYLLPMAEYFGSKCSDSFRSLTLIEVIGADFGEDISSAIEKWFVDNERGVKANQADALSLRKIIKPVVNKSKEKYASFHGANAELDAFELMKEIISHSDNVKTVYLLSNCNNFNKSADLLLLSNNFLRELSENGIKIIRILPDCADLGKRVAEVLSWLPLLSGGNAESYFYKGIRDGVINSIMFIVPGVAAMFSESVGGIGPTVVTTDKRAVFDFEKMFKSYLSYCDAADRCALFSESIKSGRIINEFAKENEECICISALGSAELMPNVLFNNSRITEIFPLIMPKELDLESKEETRLYLKQLERILCLTETEPLYNAIPESFDIMTEYSVFVKRNCGALIIPNQKEKACALITHPASVSALWQYYMNKYIGFKSCKEDKHKTAEQIKSVMSRLNR